jgi:hypothetical protein
VKEAGEVAATHRRVIGLGVLGERLGDENRTALPISPIIILDAVHPNILTLIIPHILHLLNYHLVCF